MEEVPQEDQVQAVPQGNARGDKVTEEDAEEDKAMSGRAGEETSEEYVTVGRKGKTRKKTDQRP